MSEIKEVEGLTSDFRTALDEIEKTYRGVRSAKAARGDVWNANSLVSALCELHATIEDLQETLRDLCGEDHNYGGVRP